MKSAAIRQSADNITVVFIAFDNFFKEVRESKGDLSKFEYDRLELQKMDLLLPSCLESSTTPNAQQQEILIDDTLSATQIYHHSGLVISDTGDHSFGRTGTGKDEKLSDIAEEDAISMVSERNRLHKQQLQQR